MPPRAPRPAPRASRFAPRTPRIGNLGGIGGIGGIGDIGGIGGIGGIGDIGGIGAKRKSVTPSSEISSAHPLASADRHGSPIAGQRRPIRCLHHPPSADRASLFAYPGLSAMSFIQHRKQ
ncbi:MAG: hypothetical protein QM766_11065 [Burkholderiaceae bacterium]